MLFRSTIVFDKTGTLTHGHKPEVIFHGALSDDERSAVKTLTSYSTHPLSKLITRSMADPTVSQVSDFKEIPGKGIEGTIAGVPYKVGSSEFTESAASPDMRASHVYVAVNNISRGYFVIRTSIRQNISSMLKRLGDRCVALLSGDHDGDKAAMRTLFGDDTLLLFNQSPHDKLSFIKELQQKGRKVLMVGDGLNDAGALKQSDVGIAVTEDSGVFTPASDGILYGNQLPVLDRFLDLSRASSYILRTGFVISFCYNAIALSFAVTGHLTPLVAAILMPLSSISVVGFATLAVNFSAKKILGNVKQDTYEIRHR